MSDWKEGGSSCWCLGGGGLCLGRSCMFVLDGIQLFVVKHKAVKMKHQLLLLFFFTY